MSVLPKLFGRQAKDRTMPIAVAPDLVPSLLRFRNQCREPTGYPTEKEESSPDLKIVEYFKNFVRIVLDSRGHAVPALTLHRSCHRLGVKVVFNVY